MARTQRIPIYTIVVGGLLLVVMVVGFAQGNPVGAILATMLGLFVVAPALVIWLHERHAPAGTTDATETTEATAHHAQAGDDQVGDAVAESFAEPDDCDV
jgi:hypothetical protein